MNGASEAPDFLAQRLRTSNDFAIRPEGEFVAYWMTAARRVHWNFALERAVAWAVELKRPLVIVEVLACGGRWDSDRFHRFTLDGMADNARQLARHSALFYPFIEPKPGEARKLFKALAELACVVVTDDYPVALPAVKTVDPKAKVKIEAIDGIGLLPLRAADKAFVAARSFRRWWQSVLLEYIVDVPQSDPLARKRLPQLEALPAEITKLWPAADVLQGDIDLSRLPIDHKVEPLAIEGGATTASKVWRHFLKSKLSAYCDDRNKPEADGASGLSSYLHFGHISPHEIFHDLIEHEKWNPSKLPDRPNGKNEGWWNMSAGAEAFLDQVVTWRELGFNACQHLPDYDKYESLPAWARATLAKHARDKRQSVYTLDEFATAATHDPLWNAAQRQLVREGRIHNYMRMVWGKKILEWSASPEDAWDTLIELNNRFSIDGQDPNSYTGIAWTLGRYDRPWAPERPIFGTIRYMSSDNTARKYRVKRYIEEYGTLTPLLR